MFLRDGRKPVSRLLTAVGVVALLGLGVGACGDDDDGAEVRESGPGASGSGSASGSASGGSGSASAPASGSGSASGTATECVFVGNSDEPVDTTVTVTLSEFSLDPVPPEVPAGTIEFVAHNQGAEPHEVVIARFDGEPTDLPTDAEGAADESQLPADAVIGEIEGFASGQTCAAAFDLTPGRYLLFCNIVEQEEGETEAHYGMGMTTSFVVT